MKIKIRRSIVNVLGLLVILIQIYRYTFDLMTNLKLEGCVFCVALMMALNIKGLGAIILGRFSNTKSESDAR